MEAKHTPGPWHVNAIDSKRGRIVGDETTTEHFDKLQINSANATIATVYRRNDARAIVRAVNSHAELVAALRAICEYCNVKQAKPGDSYNIPADGVLLAKARAALAKAEGETLHAYAQRRIAELRLGDSPTNCHGVVAHGEAGGVRLSDGVGFDELVTTREQVDTELRQMREWYDESK